MDKWRNCQMGLILLFACAIGLWPLTTAEAQAPSQGALEQLAVYPTLIVYNAKIYPMDPSLSTHQAMAIRGNRVWKLGTNDEIRALAGPRTELLDARGRTVLPGLIDAHTHPQLWGGLFMGSKYDPQLRLLFAEGKNLQEVKSRMSEAIRARIQQAGPDKWIIVSIPPALSGQAMGPRGEITTEELERIAPNTPVAVVGGITGYYAFTTKAKELTKKALGREVLYGTRWAELGPFDVILGGQTEKVADFLHAEMVQMLPFGITAAMTRVESPQVIRSLRYLDRQGKMPLRWAWNQHIGFTLAENPSEFYRLIGDIVGWGTDYLWMSGVGAEGWNGGCINTSAAPREERMRKAQEEGERYAISVGRCSMYPGNRLFEAHVAAARAGLRLANIHTTGDRSMDAAFQMADQLISEGAMTLEEIKQQRWGFDHGNMLRPDQAVKAAKYGFWMTFQVNRILNEEDVLKNYGPEYVSWVIPAKTWLDAGARFTLNTDARLYVGDSDEERLTDEMLGTVWSGWPKEWLNTVWPWLGVWVTREVNGKVFSPQMKLDRTTVMKAWTIWSAEYMLRENDLGSLEPGKLADFIIADKDYFTIPEREINNIKTLLTAIGGQVKFKTPNF